MQELSLIIESRVRKSMNAIHNDRLNARMGNAVTHFDHLKARVRYNMNPDAVAQSIKRRFQKDQDDGKVAIVSLLRNITS